MSHNGCLYLQTNEKLVYKTTSYKTIEYIF